MCFKKELNKDFLMGLFLTLFGLTNTAHASIKMHVTFLLSIVPSYTKKENTSNIQCNEYNEETIGKI